MAGIDGNGQSELVYGITGLIPIEHGQVILNGKDITKESIRQKCLDGVAHIPEDRHKDGLVFRLHTSGKPGSAVLLYQEIPESRLFKI